MTGTFQLDAKKQFFQPHVVSPQRRRPLSSAAGRERLLHVVRRRRPLRQLLRRQPSALRRQRRQGDGLGEGRLSARRRASSRRNWRRWTPRVRTRGTRRGRRSCSVSTTSSPRMSRRGATHADDRRSDRQGAGRRAALPPGPVLPAAELRDVAPARRERSPLLMEGIALTGAWVDKERACCR